MPPCGEMDNVKPRVAYGGAGHFKNKDSAGWNISNFVILLPTRRNILPVVISQAAPLDFDARFEIGGILYPVP